MLKLIKHPLKNLRYLLGILHGSRAFIGPHMLSIILTNDCNNQCVYCWFNSPLNKVRMPKGWKKQKLDFEKVKGIIDDAKELGTESIIISGGGEPFLYPNIYETVEYIKKKGFRCILLTNGIYINREGVKRLLDLKVDELCLNLSSGSARGYTAQHPTQDKKTFYHIQDWLLYLKKLKKDRKVKKPHLILLNIISKMNYKDVNEMSGFGEDLGADEMRLIPIMPTNATSRLILNKAQRDLLCKELSAIRNKVRIKNNLNEFIRQIGYKSYLKGRIDRELPMRMPCYIGWASSEVRAEGVVMPCAAYYHRPLGSIYEKSFKEIWHSREYNLFRKLSRTIKKDKTFECIYPSNKDVCTWANCAIHMFNVRVHRILRPFNYRRILKQEKKN